MKSSFHAPLPDAISEEWKIPKLTLRPSAVWSIAIGNLWVRAVRTLLTLLTIATCSAFLIFLLTTTRSDNAADRDAWQLMLTMSLIVCAAGVSNTMLMSVTQRYREIGTMKCLGALDSLILTTILLEASIVGAVGSGVGVLVGLVVCYGLGFLEYGVDAIEYLSFSRLPEKILLTFGIGIVLTALSACVPAFIASRLPPMAAMRGDKS